MYSPFYYFYNICKDKMLSQSVSTSELISFLEDIPELMQESPHHFRNSGQFPYWTSISLFNAPSYDAYPEHHADSVHTTSFQ